MIVKVWVEEVAEGPEEMNMVVKGLIVAVDRVSLLLYLHCRSGLLLDNDFVIYTIRCRLRGEGHANCCLGKTRLH